MGNIKEIKQVEISLLIPYENNTKIHSEKQLDKIAESIKEFGFISPVIVDNEYNIIAGHGRTEAAKRLGLKNVPCLFVEGLTDEQRKAYIIADNRLTEMGTWNKDLVASELSLLDINGFNLDVTGFSIKDIDSLQLSIPKAYGSERDRTIKAYNLDIDVEMQQDYWQMPIIRNDGYTPDGLIGFNYAKTSKEKNVGIHFFIDDYQFERIWNEPERYVDILKQYQCVISPEFSLYWDMPLPMKIWNTYRNRFIGSFLQQNGIKVIPSVCWADKNTYDFCFEGIEQGSIVAVETNGAKDKETSKRWKNGMDELIKRINPSKIIVYGGLIDYDFGDIEIIPIENQVIEKWRNNDKV